MKLLPAALACTALLIGCGPKRGGDAAKVAASGGVSQRDRFEAAGGVGIDELPPVWKPGVRPPTQGSGSRLGIGAGASGDAAGGVTAPDPSGLSALPPTGGEGARDVGPIHVAGGPGLPDGLLGASISRLRFPMATVAEEDTGIAVNLLFELDWDGIPVLLKLQHRHAKDLARRTERYVQRYWIYPKTPMPLRELLTRLPPMRALERKPDLYGCEPAKDGVVRIRARASSPLATSIGRGYSLAGKSLEDYYLTYEVLFIDPAEADLDGKVMEIGVDVETAGEGALRPWPEGCWE